MFISVGYGRDANGRVSMNFGPLNQDGGERRLNVLTTRAKYRCEVFTNLTADDIDLSRTDARGVEVLKEYLQFAETGELALPTPTGRGPDSPFEEAVAARLRAQGYDVEHQVGVAGFYIDLAVRDPERPGRYLLGIECDGATYHSARMARVRDRTRQSVLENLGWTIHRIWSTDWFRTPEAQLGDAVAAIERAQVGATAPDDDAGGSSERAAEDGAAEDGSGMDPSGEDASGGEVSRIPSRDIERAKAEEEADLPVEPYETASPPVQVQGSLHEAPTRRLAGWVEEVVQVESPVHEEVMARRIVAAAGVSRLGSRIREALEDATAYAARKGWIRKTDSLLFDPEQDEVPVRDRSALEGRTRDIAYVPGPEIARAAQEIVDVSFGIGEDELIQQVGRHLGFARVGSNIRERIESIIATMLENDLLERKDGHLVVPS
jgi:very-short-patch-repair endonuclease